MALRGRVQPTTMRRLLGALPASGHSGTTWTRTATTKSHHQCPSHPLFARASERRQPVVCEGTLLNVAATQHNHYETMGRSGYGYNTTRIQGEMPPTLGAGTDRQALEARGSTPRRDDEGAAQPGQQQQQEDRTNGGDMHSRSWTPPPDMIDPLPSLEGRGWTFWI